MEIPLLFYFPDQTELDPAEMSQKLKCSLSQVLTHFYPFAGRIKDNFSVQCTDEGAEFIETLIDYNLSDILKTPDPVLFQKLLPARNVSSIEASTRFLLMVQANFFKEGGLVIGVRISHKIADMSTLNSFVNTWAGLATESHKVEFPIFGASTMFPPIDNLATAPTMEGLSNCVVVTRRYVFNVATITALKSIAATESVSNPTSVEVVSALIWKCAMKASRKHNHSMKLNPSVINQAMNLRRRLDPPLPDSFVGNLTSYFIPRVEGDEVENIGLQTLVIRMREGKDGMKHYIEQLSGEHGSKATLEAVANVGGLMKNRSVEFYLFTSWCRFPLYEIDFGRGKPRWVSGASFLYKNFVVLIDTPGMNGIEAWVTLDEATMTIFETDDELLQLARLNPSIP